MLIVSIVADSRAPHGARLTTFACTYPRFIHAEVLTHRVFSRNSSSSRALPVKRLIEQVRANPALPLYWARNQKGMTASEEVDTETRVVAMDYWFQAAETACDFAEALAELGVHKQLANRVLEPFAHVTTLLSSTTWENFLELRDHPAAQQEMQQLAAAIRHALDASQPTPVAHGDWHLPFVTADDPPELETRRQLSVARCARVSLLNHDGQSDRAADLALYQRLATARPPHLSPFEHVATPLSTADAACANFQGWQQWRASLERAQ